MRIFTLTVAFCPAVLLARCLMEYRKNRTIIPEKHIVILGHYPINKDKNNNDIKMLVESYGEAELWDPGEDIGSAQSQQWALDRLDIGIDDAYINWDPDSNCKIKGWDLALKVVLENDPQCTLVSCLSPMTQYFAKQKGTIPAIKEACGIQYGIYPLPVPFNLSIWRYSFIKEIGGIPQMGLWFGEVEALWYHHSTIRQKYHAYLMSYEEEESGKYMQDAQHNEYKTKHIRTVGPDQFIGSFSEYLAYKHHDLFLLNTCKNLNTKDIFLA